MRHEDQDRMFPLKTARLVLEPLTQAHAELMVEGLRDEALYDYIADRPYPDAEALRERYARLETRRSPDGRDRWLNWILLPLGSAEPVGYVQATVRPGESAAIAYVLFRAAWGRGLASEAVSAVIGHLRRDGTVPLITATADPRNLRSIALLERLGFTRTAYRRAAAEIRGEVCDEVDYVLPIQET